MGDTEAYSKKQLLQHLQAVATPEFLQKHKIAGSKPWDKLTKEAVVAIYQQHEAAGGAAISSAPQVTAPVASTGASATPSFNFSLSGAPPAGGLPNLFAPQAGAPAAFSFNFNLGAGGKGDDDDEEDDGRPRGRGARGNAKGAKGSTPAALAANLGTMTLGGSGGGLVSVGSTADSDARIKALKELQAEADAAEEEFNEKVKQLERELDAKVNPLTAKRKAIVTGAESVPGATTTGPIESFWLTAMQNCPRLADEVQLHDQPILKHLTDISVSRELPDGKEGFTLSFEFAPNPFFTNAVLTKTYTMDDDDDDTLEDVQGCTIHWKEGKDVTMRTVTKKQKKKGKERTITVNEPVDSFFSFFAPPKVPDEAASLDDEEADMLQETLEMDYDLARVFRDKLVPDAVNWYTGAPPPAARPWPHALLPLLPFFSPRAATAHVLRRGRRGRCGVGLGGGGGGRGGSPRGMVERQCDEGGNTCGLLPMGLRGAAGCRWSDH